MISSLAAERSIVGVREYWSIEFQMHHCITPPLHYSSLPLLPAATESPVELHHRIELPSPHAGQCQLLIEQLLVGDQDLEIIRQPGVITQAHEVGSILQSADTHFQLNAHTLEFFNTHERIRHFPESVLRRPLILSDRLFEARFHGLVVCRDAPALQNRLQSAASNSPDCGAPAGCAR